MIQNAEIILSSNYEYEKLISQVQIGNEILAVISHDADSFEILIARRSDGKPWEFKFDDFVETIQGAKRALEEPTGWPWKT